MPSGKKVKSLKNKYSAFFSNRRDIPELEPELEISVERIYPSLSKSFEDSLEETVPILRNMNAHMLQWMNDDRDRTDQKTRELEGSLGMALQALQRLKARTQVMEKGKLKGEPEKVTIVLMENKLTKSKKALMTPKQLCPTGAAGHAMENKVNPGEEDTEKLAKLRETMIKKTREYSKTFPKYKGESRKGQEWCAKICYHAREYRVDTI